MLARLYSKSFKLSYSSMWTKNFQIYKLSFKEAEELEIKFPAFVGSWRKQGNSRKTSPVSLWESLWLWITTNCGRFLKRWEYQITLPVSWGFPGGSDGKASTCNVGDLGSIPGLGRSPGEGNDNPLQYSCLKNSMNGGAWWTTVHGVTESDKTEWLHFLSFFSCLLRNLYAGQEATVRTLHGTTDWFKIGKGVHQGCILSPCLFNLYAEYIMWNAGLDESQDGIKIAGRNISNFNMQMIPL